MFSDIQEEATAELEAELANLRAQLAAARVAVAEVCNPVHSAECRRSRLAHDSPECICGAYDRAVSRARRAVAAGWKWDEGCRETNGVLPRVGEHYEESSHIANAAVYKHWHSLPDFRDAATRGVLLEQVRERWGDECLCTAWTGVNVYGWAVRDRGGKMLVWGHDSETDALVAALEAAPKRGVNG